MQILVTNDDGVHAAGLAALVTGLAEWCDAHPPAERPGITVVAPLANHSGASSAVGTVFERDSIPYRRIRLAGRPDVPAFGIDGSPALATIVGNLGAFGPRPDLVVSGINLGVNVGRSILHSGTVGATLTGAQLGSSGLAVSIRADAEPCWPTAASLAVAVLPHLLAAPAPTVLNLNVPSVPLDQLRGVRPGRIGGAAVIRGATDPTGPTDPPEPGRVATDDRGGTDGGYDGETDNYVPSATAIPSRPGTTVTDEHEGHLLLRLGAAVPELGDVSDESPADDAALVANGFASLTPLLGVREDRRPTSRELVRQVLAALPPQVDDRAS